MHLLDLDIILALTFPLQVLYQFCNGMTPGDGQDGLHFSFSLLQIELNRSSLYITMVQSQRLGSDAGEDELPDVVFRKFLLEVAINLNQEGLVLLLLEDKLLRWVFAII